MWAYPIVARDPRNNGMVGWARLADEKVTLNMSRLVAGKPNPKGPEVFPKQEDDAWFPAVTVGAQGNAAAAWTESATSSGGIGNKGTLWVRVFE